MYETLQTIYTETSICIPTNIIDIKNLTEVEDAILKYILSIKKYINLENHEEFISAAVKIALNTNKKGNQIFCLKGESNFEKLISFTKNEYVRKWIWLIWREVAVAIKRPYLKLIDIENRAARRNGKLKFLNNLYTHLSFIFILLII